MLTFTKFPHKSKNLKETTEENIRIRGIIRGNSQLKKIIPCSCK